MARKDREARERLDVEATTEAYMQEFCLQHPELVEAEWMIFADTGDEVIIISSSDEAEDGCTEGGEDEEIDVDEWRSVFPDNGDGGIGPGPVRGTPYLTRKDWLGHKNLIESSLVKLSLV
ncbi:Zinc finger protein CONSTANS-LIKE 13 [Hordeum vulgare]|nr:Zinc finger protein CONSTANS-LIKE 13 [Hordeum vulgare]